MLDIESDWLLEELPAVIAAGRQQPRRAAEERARKEKQKCTSHAASRKANRKQKRKKKRSRHGPPMCRSVVVRA